jgi:hypothetical protein
MSGYGLEGALPEGTGILSWAAVCAVAAVNQGDVP